MKPLISIVVVVLNAGEKLFLTLSSIQSQTFTDYEVVIKDGGSKDRAVDLLEHIVAGDFVPEKMGSMHEDIMKVAYTFQKNANKEFLSRLNIIKKPDKSIYEGMNQALENVMGKYVCFMNCGDYFFAEDSLSTFLKEAGKSIDIEKAEKTVLYADVYDAQRNVKISATPEITGFSCYRNIPCHQACLYSTDLFKKEAYNPRYKIRADYEHFLRCFYEYKAAFIRIPIILAVYEGGGFSESKENISRDKAEHKEITAKYMPLYERTAYKAVMIATLQPVRKFLAENPKFSGFYQSIKDFWYSKEQ